MFGVDLDESVVPQDLIVVVIDLALDRRRNHGIDANNGSQESGTVPFEIFRGHPKQRALFIDPMPDSQGGGKCYEAIEMKF
jgi:hypothetical protein